MAEIIYNAVPFSGGTVSMGYANSSMCKLTDDGKFVALFAQNSPNALIASVIQVTNAKTVTPTLTVIRQQVLVDAPSGASTYATVRVWRLADDRILVGVIITATSTMMFDVYTVNATTGELTKLTTSSFSGSAAISQASAISGSSFELKQDTILFASTSSPSFILSKIDFNSTTNTLTSSVLDTFGVASNVTRTSFQRKIGTTDQAVLTLSWYTTNILGAMRIGRIYHITSTGSVTTYSPAQGTTNIYHRVFGQLTSDTGFFSDGTYFNEYQYSTNSLKRYSVFTGATDIDSNHAALDCFSLSNDYHIIASIPVSSLSSTPESSNGNTLHIRVIKYTDYAYAQASPGTSNSTKGLVIPTFYAMWNDKPMIEFMNNDVIVAMGLKSATEFTIKTVWF
jgi:hypothetical protein